MQDIFTPDFRKNPYPIYHQLRGQAPMMKGGANFAGGHDWWITSYAESAAALKDPNLGHELARVFPNLVSTDPEATRPVLEMVGQWMLFRDPPDHTRLRGLVNKAFIPAMVERLVPQIEAITDGLIDQIMDQPAERRQVDMLEYLAFPLPVLVIAEMLGVPAEDRPLFRTWANLLAAVIDVRQSDDILIEGSQVAQEITRYFQTLLAQRRRQPRNDLLSALLAIEERGDKLNEKELIAMVTLLLTAGHETTVNLIGSGLLALLSHPEQLALLRANPALMPGAIEECLRYDSPVQMTSRFVLAETKIGGQQLKAGDNITIWLGAANRDPAQFANPDQFDIARTANRPLSFGGGIHYCLGAPLARVEGQIAMRKLFERLPALHLTDDPLEWREMIVFRGLKRLLVNF